MHTEKLVLLSGTQVIFQENKQEKPLSITLFSFVLKKNSCIPEFLTHLSPANTKA